MGGWGGHSGEEELPGLEDIDASDQGDQKLPGLEAVDNSGEEDTENEEELGKSPVDYHQKLQLMVTILFRAVD